MSRLGLVALLACAAAVLPAPAHAEKWTDTDDHKDVTGFWYSPDPAPCGSTADVDGTSDKNDDLVAVAVRHGRHLLRLKARFRDLDAGSEQSVTFRVRTSKKTWEVDVERWQKPSGKFRIMGFMGKLPDGAGRPARGEDCGTTGSGYTVAGSGCRIHPEVDLDADIVRATIARRCLASPAWVRVGLDAYGWDEPEDPDDPSFTVFSDHSGAAYGERVSSGAE